MATTDLEVIVLNGLDLTEWGDIESLQYTPAAKKAQFVENADADGGALVKESRYTSAYFELQVRAERKEDTEAALAHVGELLDAMQGCERTRGGALSEWVPNNTELEYSFYALMAEIMEVPIEVQGDLAGWLLECPVIKLRVTCRPFLYTAERTIVEATESAAAPSQELFVKGVKGDVPAEARLIVTDKATQNRRFAAWGRDIVADEEPPATLITAASLVTEGFSGEAKTRSGAYSEEKVKRATAVSSATTMCGTGGIEHVGSFAVYLRVYAASENARFRISYRNGDGPLIPLKWQTPPVVENFSDIYMGEVFLDAVELGEQVSEIRIEHKSLGSAAANDVNYLLLLPTRASIAVRGRANNTPTKLLAYDAFEQTEGALSGKSLNVGGTWSGAGDAVDFTVIAADDVARRTEVSDANVNTGRYALAGTEEPATVQISATCSLTMVAATGRLGLLARYASTENWLMATLTYSGGKVVLAVVKRASGTVTTLGEVTIPLSQSTIDNLVTGGITTLSQALVLAVDAAGRWYAKADSVEIEGFDSALAAGGALEDGKVGVYDSWASASANTRKISGFEVISGGSLNVVCYSGQSIEFNHQGVLREDAAGEKWGQPDLPRGANFYLEPEGADGRINRIVLRMRRNDIVAEADSAVADKHSVEVKVRERFLLPR